MTDKTIKVMVEKFQCPGCVGGNDTKCGSYSYDTNKRRCTSHVLGTFTSEGGNIALGMPKGFNKPGWNDERTRILVKINVEMWTKGEKPEYNHLNVPVWALEQDGYLFVRVYSPRVNVTGIDIVEGGTLKDVPQAIDVSTFIEEID